MLGAGLIKIRGDASWRDLTALYYHFETQPIPNGLSRWFHFLPRGVLRGGTLFNHLAELVAPWFVFWPRIARHIAGGVIIAFPDRDHSRRQSVVPELAHDHSRARLFRRSRLGENPAASPNEKRRSRARAAPWFRSPHDGRPPGRSRRWSRYLSIQPVLNIFSPHQIMNTSFDPLDLVNTYGAFGSVGKERYNVVFEGTEAAVPNDDATWKAYPYKGLPVALERASAADRALSIAARLADVVRGDGLA